MAQAVLMGGAWDGHVEEVSLGEDGLPPERLPRNRDTSVWTEDTGFLPMRIPAQGYRRRGPDPRDASRWFYEPDPDDHLSP
jgi:hypothetical protein